jgi:hypothetical protein
MLNYYMLKTSEHPYSNELANSAAIFNLGETVIDEAYAKSADHIRNSGVRCIPSFVAIYQQEDGSLRCIHEASLATELLGFEATAQEKLTLFLGE